MCGRYVIEGTTELSERFQLRQIPADLFPEWTTYNAAPTQPVAAPQPAPAPRPDPIIIEDPCEAFPEVCDGTDPVSG